MLLTSLPLSICILRSTGNDTIFNSAIKSANKTTVQLCNKLFIIRMLHQDTDTKISNRAESIRITDRLCVNSDLQIRLYPHMIKSDIFYISEYFELVAK